jgi:hypothetical protein
VKKFNGKETLNPKPPPLKNNPKKGKREGGVGRGQNKEQKWST